MVGGGEYINRAEGEMCEVLDCFLGWFFIHVEYLVIGLSD